MAPANGLLHELWEYTEDGMPLWLFCYAGPGGDGARALLPRMQNSCGPCGLGVILRQ